MDNDAAHLVFWYKQQIQPIQEQHAGRPLLCLFPPSRDFFPRLAHPALYIDTRDIDVVQLYP